MENVLFGSWKIWDLEVLRHAPDGLKVQTMVAWGKVARLVGGMQSMLVSGTHVSDPRWMGSDFLLFFLFRFGFLP
jgi:hypothetical protein